MSRDLSTQRTLRYIYVLEVDNRGEKSRYFGHKKIFYTGQTHDIKYRLLQHLSGVGSKFLNRGFRNAQKKLVFVRQIFCSEPEAVKMEYKIKRYSVEKKKSFINDICQNDLVAYVPFSHLILRNMEDKEIQHVIKLKE